MFRDYSNDMVAKDREYPKRRCGLLQKDGGDSPVAAYYNTKNIRVNFEIGMVNRVEHTIFLHNITTNIKNIRATFIICYIYG